MTEQERIIKSISLDKFKDPRIIQHIVNHPILFAKHVMANPDDYRPVRIRYFGVFTQKYMYNKEVFKQFNTIKQWFAEYPDLLGLYDFNTLQECNVYVRNLLDSNNKVALKEIYDTLSKAIQIKESFEVVKLKCNKTTKKPIQ